MKLNTTFQQMMEDYFAQADELKVFHFSFFFSRVEISLFEMKDTRPELHYQVGATPERKERARNRCSEVESFDPLNKPVTVPKSLLFFLKKIETLGKRRK